MAHLAALISSASADHVFAVQPPAEHTPGQGSAADAGGGERGMRAAFGDTSMLWAFQAHSAARAGGRLSLVTFGAHCSGACSGAEGIGSGPELLGGQLCNAAAAAALALARTHWMEARAAAGPALDIWPPTALPTQQVGMLDLPYSNFLGVQQKATGPPSLSSQAMQATFACMKITACQNLFAGCHELHAAYNRSCTHWWTAAGSTSWRCAAAACMQSALSRSRCPRRALSALPRRNVLW